MPRTLLASLLALTAVHWSATAAEIRPVVPIDGEPFLGALTGARAQWQLTFRSGGIERRMAAGDLVRWGWFAQPGQGPILVLADGGLLAADVLEADQQRLSADSQLFGRVHVPLELLAGIVFRLPAEQGARDALLDGEAAASGESDRIVLVNGDSITGRFLGIDHDSVRMESAVGALDVPMYRASALVLHPLSHRRPAPQGVHAILGFGDGSRLLVERLVLDEKSLNVTLAGGPAWSTSPGNLVAIQPLGGRAVYLSDLKPVDYRHVPFLTLSWPYRADHSVTGARLRAGGHLYLKGLGVHSAARLTYALGGEYRRFQAELAIDDQTCGHGSVRFRVFVDGRQQYLSPIVRGRSAPIPVSVDVSGAKRLDLLVDFADWADQLDHADWLEARLVK